MSRPAPVLGAGNRGLNETVMPQGLILAALGCAAAAASASAVDAETRIAADRPALLCRASAEAPAVLVLLALDSGPDGEASGRLAVTADTGETTQIGLFPGGPFAAGDGAARQFLLPGGTATRCWQVALTGPGTASIALAPAPGTTPD